MLTREEGGRHTPVVSGYRPQFFLRTADVSGVLHLGDARLAMPGDTVLATVPLDTAVALTEGQGFAIREGNLTVGAGRVRRLLD